MSIDLDVFMVRPGKNLRARWQAAFADCGMICEFRPDFDPDTWRGTDLVAKLQVIPNAFPGAELYGDRAFVTGCGMETWRSPEFDDERKDLLARCPRQVQARLKRAK